MFRLALEKTYQDGEIILKEGNFGDWVYIVLSGSVAISRTIGDKTYDLGLLSQDDVFDEISFFGVLSGLRQLGLLERLLLALLIVDLFFMSLTDSRTSSELLW